MMCSYTISEAENQVKRRNVKSAGKTANYFLGFHLQKARNEGKIFEFSYPLEEKERDDARGDDDDDTGDDDISRFGRW